MLLNGMLVTAKNEVSVVTVESENLYANIEPLLDADAVSCIRPRFCPTPPSTSPTEAFVFYCDDEFGRKQPSFNEVGSHFYGYQYHGNPILGSILILKELHTSFAPPETVSLTDGDIDYLRKYLRRKFQIKSGGANA